MQCWGHKPNQPLQPESGHFPTREGPDMNESETRVELFDAFRGLSGLVPQMRAGQLMAAVGELCADLHGRGLWDASDAELLEAAWQFRRNLETATRDPTPQQA